MRRKVTLEYAAGVLDKVGGFAIHKNPANNKNYLYYKVVSDEPSMQKVMEFLKRELKIEYNNYPKKGKNIFYVTKMVSVDILIGFMKQFCYRTDYKKYKKDKKLGIKID